MAALVTPYSTGNQAQRIVAAFSSQSMAGLSGLHARGLGQEGGGAGITSQIIDAATKFIQSRWGEQRGTIVYDPATGQIRQKQAGDYPIQTQAPGYGTTTIATSEGFGTGIATGTLVAMGIGAVVLVILMGRRK